MNALAQQLVAIVIVLAIVLGPAFLGAWFLLRRKRRARQERRSPLSTDLLRAPGHGLRERLDEARLDATIDLVALMALPGWFVERQGRGPVAVFGRTELERHLLKTRDARALSAEQMQRVVHQVEQRCRDVKPTYRPVDDDD
jgi:hypothetical protein